MLSSRLEECQAQQQALSGQLTDANKTNKKVCSSCSYSLIDIPTSSGNSLNDLCQNVLGNFSKVFNLVRKSLNLRSASDS